MLTKPNLVLSKSGKSVRHETATKKHHQTHTLDGTPAAVRHRNNRQIFLEVAAIVAVALLVAAQAFHHRARFFRRSHKPVYAAPNQ